MRWQETVASRARYGDVAERIFGDAEIIWERSEDDYQGSCNVLALLPTGEFAHYEWTYGSCSVCDSWESKYGWDVFENGSDARDKIEAEMREDMVTFPDITTLERYLHTDNSEGVGEEFREMGEAFDRWLTMHLASQAAAKEVN